VAGSEARRFTGNIGLLQRRGLTGAGRGPTGWAEFRRQKRIFMGGDRCQPVFLLVSGE